MPQLALTNALTAAIRPYVKAKAIDQVYGNIRAWNYIKRISGVHETVGGDLELHFRIIHRRLDKARFIATPDEEINIAPVDAVRTMAFDWTEEVISIPLTDLTDFGPTAGAGDLAIINKAKGEVDLALPDMAFLIGNLLYTGGANPGEPIGIDTIVANTGAYGALSRVLFPVLNATVQAVGGAATLADLHTNTLAATFGNREPDLFLTDSTLFVSAVSVIQDAYRYTPSDVEGDVTGKGRPAIVLGRHMIWDEPVTAGDVIGFNLSGFHVQVHKSYNMVVEDFIQAPRQPTAYHQPIKWMGRFAHEEPRVNFKMTGVTGFTT